MTFTLENFNKLKKTYPKYLDGSVDIGSYFGGPSLYFHIRALSERKIGFLSDKHIEYIYATLASWGMHRMGNTKTKMVNFIEFKDSIQNKKDILGNYRDLKIEDMNRNDFKILTDICFTLNVSQSNSRIVGNSKALAHILPDIIPPIDRRYTILFFQKEAKNLLNEKGKLKKSTLKKTEERDYFKHIIEKTSDFVNHIKMDKRVMVDELFNTSFPKIFDNLIIMYVSDIINSSGK